MTTGTQTRFVTTTDARNAVRGHEAEIVQTIGIPWKDGQRDHIDCPYPGHRGAKDWRLNAKGRAICTCTEGKTDSVFDIVSKVEVRDFEASKIRCVEIVGAVGIIKQKSGEGHGSFQATDAHSLLNAPADRRDDSLPRAYLAHRLGVDASAVPMPSTPKVGLAALTYYDPPKGKGMPVAVGDFPCAVFGTVDVDGKTHAHRIYVATAGAGKADLGRQADGTPRDPKKSAKRREGDESTAGRAVLWGNPKVAPWIIVVEGIETASAVAYAFWDEIGRNQVAVASAINAGGIEAFRPWPATKRVTIAADRDEAAKTNRPNPSRCGEQAARRFGIRNSERVTVRVALAGEAGSNTDWLDVHGAEGREAVRAGILAATAFVPTAEETQQEHDRANGAAEIKDIAKRYPLPQLDGLTLTYLRTKSGKIWVHRWVEVKTELVSQPISSPFGVLARLRYVDADDAYGLRLVVEDMSGKCRAIDVDRATFARQGASETRAMLFAAGLRTEGEGENIAVKCLKAADPRDEIAVVSKPGWHTLAGLEDRVFVCPDGQVIGAPDGQQPELSVNAQISPAIARGGTLQGWKDAIAVAVMVPGCEHWVIGAIAGFAGCVISLTGLDTCGINFSGLTTSGKTTAQRLGVSAWSKAASDHPDSLLKTARATVNGTELMASRSTGTILAMDELAHVNGKELGKIVYGLASGAGKVRMSENATQKRGYSWATHVVLSSEKSLEEKITGDGGEFTPGMAVRIPDIDVTGVNRDVDRATLEKIDAVRRNYGHAGPAFVQALVAEGVHRDPEQIRAGVRLYQDSLAGAGAGSAMKRAAEPFAILMAAGEMAQEFGLLPREADIGRAIKWAWQRFQNSSDAVALDPKAQVVASIRAWIAERWGSSIHPTVSADATRVPVRDAVGWYDNKAVYIPAHRIMEASGSTLKEREVAKALNELGFIVDRKDREHLSVGYIPGIKQKLKAYALCRSEFGRGLT